MTFFFQSLCSSPRSESALGPRSFPQRLANRGFVDPCAEDLILSVFPLFQISVTVDWQIAMTAPAGGSSPLTEAKPAAAGIK